MKKISVFIMLCLLALTVACGKKESDRGDNLSEMSGDYQSADAENIDDDRLTDKKDLAEGNRSQDQRNDENSPRNDIENTVVKEGCDQGNNNVNPDRNFDSDQGNSGAATGNETGNKGNEKPSANNVGNNKQQSTSSSNSQGGGTDSDQSQTGAQTDDSKKPAHTHSWVPHYKTITIVDSQAYDEVVYNTVEHTICNQCGADITGRAVAHLQTSDQNFINNSYQGKQCYSYRSEYRKEAVNTIHHDAVTHEETIIDYCLCQCGQRKN